MSDYTPNNTYADKDALSPGTPGKEISGSDIDSELTDIQTAVASKIDEPASPSSADILYWTGSAWGARAESVGGVTIDGALAQHANLRIIRNAVTPATQIDLDADEVLVWDASASVFRRVTSLDVTIDGASSGAANQLDTGTITNDTWYHIWAISDGSTDAGLISTSATSPTLPSGYTYKGLVGAMYYTSSALVDIIQQDRQVICAENLAVSGGTQTSYTSMDLSAIVPTTAREIRGSLSGGRTGAGTSKVGIAPHDTPLGELLTVGETGGTGTTSAPYTVAVISAQTAYYKVFNGSTCTVTINGWSY